MPCLDQASREAAIVLISPDSRVVYQRNEHRPYVPASTLKLLTALTAIHHLGLTFRFRTAFYMDSSDNLKIKGYGDPMLTSEVWQEIADELSHRFRSINDLVLDISYFSQDLRIPGTGRSANPYDAPPGALCANFSTVFFRRDRQGRIVTSEAQTPITAFARGKIRSLGLKQGRYTICHDAAEAARYAGALLACFLRRKGTEIRGTIRPGLVTPEDKRVFTWVSPFTLKDVIQKMMAFSSNFVANQICITTGARVYGPPGTLDKGMRVLRDYANKELHLKDITLVEGSGVSRKNRLTVLDMATVLDRFRPYRHLLRSQGGSFYKTGTLKGIRTRAGYFEPAPGRIWRFVVFLNHGETEMNAIMACMERNFVGRDRQTARNPRRQSQ